jgi:hypothetical protein
VSPHRLTRVATLALAVSAFAAPAAGAQALRSPDARDAAEATVAPRQDLRSPDTRDAAEGRGTYNSPQVVVLKAAPQKPPADGIDWFDTGIGAGTTFGLTLVGIGGSLFLLHRRRIAHDARHVPHL